MSDIAFVLCAAASAACAVLLRRSYRLTQGPFVRWTSLCFVALAMNSAAMLIDRYMLPTVDLRILRSAIALVGMALLVYGLVWERE